MTTKISKMFTSALAFWIVFGVAFLCFAFIIFGKTSNNGSITYTIVLWLHETGYNQSDPDVTVSTTDATSHSTNEAGKTFAAGITFTTSSGTGGVTGVLSA